MSSRRVLVSGMKDVYTYVYLYEAACIALKQAEASETDKFYNCMSVILYLAFCLEAYLNHIGGRVLQYWDDDIKQNVNTKNKLKMICHQVNISMDFSRSPFQSIGSIFKFRNQLVHGQTERAAFNDEIQEVTEDSRAKFPEILWEKQCTIENAKRWLTDTEAVINKIHSAAKQGEYPFGSRAMGSMRTKSIESPSQETH